MPPPLILASSSPYRKKLVEQLGLSFTVQSPDIDERQHEGEDPSALVLRLAQEKAQKNADSQRQALWIGSDQLIVLNGTRILGKPLCFDTAFEQLSMCSGQSIEALTSLCVYQPHDNYCFLHVEKTKATFRSLSLDTIKTYLQDNEPYQCCGSVRIEKGGIRLFSAVESSDPSALVGLPLIALTTALNPYYSLS
jgi:septum formation protein